MAGKSVSDVLELTVSQAIAFLETIDGGDAAIPLLAPLADVGLEYVRLGQPVPTLSGGEAQRLKLAGHLAEAGAKSASAARAICRRLESLAAAKQAPISAGYRGGDADAAVAGGHERPRDRHVLERPGGDPDAAVAGHRGTTLGVPRTTPDW